MRWPRSWEFSGRCGQTSGRRVAQGPCTGIFKGHQASVPYGEVTKVQVPIGAQDDRAEGLQDWGPGAQPWTDGFGNLGLGPPSLPVGLPSFSPWTQRCAENQSRREETQFQQGRPSCLLPTTCEWAAAGTGAEGGSRTRGATQACGCGRCSHSLPLPAPQPAQQNVGIEHRPLCGAEACPSQLRERVSCRAGMFSARWTSRPPSRTQKARAKAAARAALAGTRQAGSAHLLHGPQDSAGKSKQRNYVASLGFQKTQLAAGWRMPWARRPELRKMRDTEEGTKRPTLTLTVARARPWVRPQHLLLSPRLPRVFRGVQPFFLALAGCPGAAQSP
ncbi:uncharacterized protein LOC116592850 [Mustela erminea]|uniref:uncharacterized protein LOC116592850 n=1 Tax=Mustela erminea TaxID=36723 RepID=UPI001387280C|nr:uncharacterized protein LOC116592850 [Mustela erminea]